MNLNILKLAVAVTFAGIASNASATTYNVDEWFSGSFLAVATNTTGTLTNYVTTNSLNFSSLISGDTSLFSSALLATVPWTFDGTNVTLCSSLCTFTETLKTGDSISGNFIFTSFSGQTLPGSTVNYTSNVTITSGTGLFSGATGGGTVSGSQTYSATSVLSGISTQRSMVSVTTAPVPEPDTYGMLLSGLALMGFVARRRKTLKDMY